MTDRDLVLPGPHLANEQAHDALAFGEGKGSTSFVQLSKELFRRCGQRKPCATRKFRSLQGPQLGLDGTLPGLEQGLCLPQFVKGHDLFLVSVEQAPHSGGDAGQLALQ